MKCVYCNVKEVEESKVVKLCWHCESMLTYAAGKFGITLTEAIDRVWSYGPDRKGCTQLYLS